MNTFGSICLVLLVTGAVADISKELIRKLGCRPAFCILSPCSISPVCSAYPLARCQDHYDCGGCTAKYFLGKTEVTSKCNKVCRCKAPPCDVSPGCPAHPLATCIDAYCDRCKAKYVLDGNEVTDTCFKPACPNLCKVNPCDISTGCPAYERKAICVNDYCTGCHAKYFYKGEDVTNKCSQQV